MARKKKKDKKPRSQRDGLPPRRLLEGMLKAGERIEAGRWTEALVLLEELDRRYPKTAEVLGMLAECYFEVGDMEGTQWALERVLQVERNDPDLVLSLAGAYMTNLRPAHALKYFRRYIERWPEHELAGEAQQSINRLEAALPDIFSGQNLSFEEGLGLALQHEEMVSLLAREQYPQALVVGRVILRNYPTFEPALNNLSEIYWVQGKTEQALEMANKALEVNENNIYALSNLVRFACLRGKPDLAREPAMRLSDCPIETSEGFHKAAEGLAYLGDDRGVLDIYQRLIKSEDYGEDRYHAAMVCHLAAVAIYHQGNEKGAINCWNKSLELLPDFEIAAQNLASMKLPVGERHAPWAFSMYELLNPRQMDNFEILIRSVSKTTDEKRIERSTRRFIERNPGILPIVPLMLDRGDETCREFALALARMLDTPEQLDHLMEYALGKSGPDQMRLEAAQSVIEAGKLPSGMTRLWINGEWIEVLLMGVELHGEPVGVLQNKDAQGLLEGAINDMRENRFAEAEENLTRAIEIEPDAPALSYNLAGAYGAQGRRREAISLVEEIHQRHPDYLFARTALASHLAREGDTERAGDLLDPLLLWKRMHFNEFDAFCGAQLELLLAEKKHSAAKSWFGIWESVDPDNPKLEIYRLRVSPLDILKKK